MHTEGVSRRAVVMAGACLTGLALVPAGLGAIATGASAAPGAGAAAESAALTYAVSIAAASGNRSEIQAAVRVGGGDFVLLTTVVYPARVEPLGAYLHHAMHAVDDVIIQDAAQRLGLPSPALRVEGGRLRHAADGTPVAPVAVWAAA